MCCWSNPRAETRCRLEAILAFVCRCASTRIVSSSEMELFIASQTKKSGNCKVLTFTFAPLAFRVAAPAVLDTLRTIRLSEALSERFLGSWLMNWIIMAALFVSAKSLRQVSTDHLVHRWHRDRMVELSPKSGFEADRQGVEMPKMDCNGLGADWTRVQLPGRRIDHIETAA